LAPTLIIAFLFATPAASQDLADWLASDAMPARLIGLIGACAGAVSEPDAAQDAFVEAGWTPVEEFDGIHGFESGEEGIMFWRAPGFCMFDTTRLGTAELASILSELYDTPSGTDADGCAQFIIENTTATLTGGGNDPQCTSQTEAALRFESTP
jgi:hypothetical protein